MRASELPRPKKIDFFFDRIHEGKDGNIASQIPLPRVVGSRAALTVMLPVPDAIYSLLPLVPASRQTLSFNITPVFFNIGINERATLAESLGTIGPQEKSNVDNFDRLNEYYLRFKKLNLPTETGTTRRECFFPNSPNFQYCVRILCTNSSKS